MKQIKPCPFCGPDGKNEEEAITLWNAAPRKEDAEMEKNCGNCKYLKLGNKAKSKWYCTKALEDEYSSCKSWVPYNPFKPTHWNLDYSCPGWEAKEPEPAPLKPSNSNGLDELCQKAISKWGEAAQINKAIEELLELATALTRYQNLGKFDIPSGIKVLENVLEEREDVEIMLRQLDVIFVRSEEWRRKKYEHLLAIVEDTEDD